MPNLQKIDLYWEGASDDHAIAKYEIYYSVGNNVLSSTPIYVDHEVGKTFLSPFTNQSITNTYTYGAATYSHTVTSFATHTFYIRTIDNIGQKSANTKVIVVDVGAVILISAVGAESGAGNGGAACSIVSVPSIPINILNLDTNQEPVANSSQVIEISSNTAFDGTNPISGLNQYWKVLIDNRLYSILLDVQGNVLASTLCGVETILNIGKVSNAVAAGPSSTGVNVCSQTSLNTNVYFTGLLSVGKILYTDSSFNNKLEGSNKWRIINYSTDGTNLTYFGVVKVGTGVAKGQVLEFSSLSQACPTNTYFCCFIGGTKILMSDYTYKNIEDVRVGDFVITFNEETKIKESNKVLLKYSPIRGDLVKILLEDSTEITSTVEHPFYVFNKGWSSYNKDLTKEYHNLYVSSLEIGDSLIRFDNRMLKITNIELVNMSAKTYNFAVEGNNNYYANNVLVHNKYDYINTNNQYQLNCIIDAPPDTTPIGGN